MIGRKLLLCVLLGAPGLVGGCDPQSPPREWRTERTGQQRHQLRSRPASNRVERAPWTKQEEQQIAERRLSADTPVKKSATC